MSKHETPMIVAYWERIGGTLAEEYCLVPSAAGQGRRRADAVLFPNGPRTRLQPGARSAPLKGHDVVVIQAKSSRLGMYLLGQALFSRDLALRCGAASVRTVALCAADDVVLRPLAERYGIEVEVLELLPARPQSRRRRS